MFIKRARTESRQKIQRRRGFLVRRYELQSARLGCFLLEIKKKKKEKRIFVIYERRVLNVSFHSLSPPLFSNNSQESSNRSIFRNRWHEILKFLFRFILSSTSLNLSRDFISRRSPIKPPIPISTNLSFSLFLEFVEKPLPEKSIIQFTLAAAT